MIEAVREELENRLETRHSKRREEAGQIHGGIKKYLGSLQNWGKRKSSVLE